MRASLICAEDFAASERPSLRGPNELCTRDGLLEVLRLELPRRLSELPVEGAGVGESPGGISLCRERDLAATLDPCGPTVKSRLH
jgi:hypothetical protein